MQALTMTWRRRQCRFALVALLAAAATAALAAEPTPAAGANPILRDTFTADPAPLVVGDTLQLYLGRDEAQRDEMFGMRAARR